MSGLNWGEVIEKNLNFGREDRSSKYKQIKSNDKRYEKFTHCSHVMIYAKTKSLAIDNFERKAIILSEFINDNIPFAGDKPSDNRLLKELMQMRCDGYIGFPGGIVDGNETPLQAVCREVKEELGWDEQKGGISDSDYQFSHVDEEKEFVFHFYATEVTESKMEEIEKNMLKASDYGTEVLGHFRVPLYTMGDAFRGFPAFLRNHFVGNSKLQLIQTVHNLKFLTEEQIIQALYSAPLITY